ncbi:DNA glycosylase [Coprinellus micaceus]|uniref:DNA glycosylase n=1 Tax=Coprinellus micaceus TaxID=71717 RepID=A0A4Y7SI45_COPMI|nr:DNA glycosylase [Coprinellus micaceus]
MSRAGASTRVADQLKDTSLLPSPLHPSRPSKKLKLQSSADPFPNFGHPTPTEVREVFELLSTSFKGPVPARSSRASIQTKNTGATCGDSPNVIDALIGTILSQNTSSRNSSTAKHALDTRFGKHNFAAIADAPLADVVEALRRGGLANKKAATIKNLLQEIKAKHGEYSLQHLASTPPSDVRSNGDIMEELMSYDGVGPKTAACVLLFCIGRDSFAVDTHVFRLSKMLGWVPRDADRIKTQMHLDRRIPDELKYGLHVMMIRHGKACKGCKREGTKRVCILKAWVCSKHVEGRDTKPATTVE